MFMEYIRGNIGMDMPGDLKYVLQVT